MQTLAFDIETDGLLREKDDRPRMTKIHCIVTEDVGTGVVWGYWDEPDLDPGFYRGGSIADGVEAIQQADRLVPHNGIGFDVPAIDRFYPMVEWPEVYDTQVLARLYFPRVGNLDKSWEIRNPGKKFPRDLFGRHSLAAWGHRRGFPKGTPPETFDVLDEDMLVYCARDVAVTAELYRYFMTFGWPEKCIKIEHDFARCIEGQMNRGVRWDRARGLALEADLRVKLGKLDRELHADLGTLVTYSPVKKVRKEQPLKLGSAIQVTDALTRKYGWEPTLYTPAGRPQWDVSVVESLPASVLVKDALLERETARAALARLADGKQAILRHVEADGRIRGYVNHNGTGPGGRCSHSHPNMNFPKVDKPYGGEFRGCITVDEGMVMVGCDMNGAEACLIAHLLQPTDGGAMIARILNGDVHTWNLNNLVLPHYPAATRQDAKNTLYAVAYKARGKKVAAMHKIPIKKGEAIRDGFIGAYEGLDTLGQKVEDSFKDKGYLRAIDGRRSIPDVPYKALNGWVQCSSGVVFKVATTIANERLGCVAGMVLHIHDEYGFECYPEHAQMVGETLVASIEQAGIDLEVRCPMTGEYKIGKTWAETH